MNILKESTTSQTLAFIPRSFPVSANLHLRRESINTTIIHSIDAVTNGAFLELSRIFDLKEGEYYSFEVEASKLLSAVKIRIGNDSGTYENNECFNELLEDKDLKLIYRGKIFVTDQDLDKYTINKGVYTEDISKNNEYVTL